MMYIPAKKNQISVYTCKKIVQFLNYSGTFLKGAVNRERGKGEEFL